MTHGQPHRLFRADSAPANRHRLMVQCDAFNCDHAVLIDPRAVFGPARLWPVIGGSNRFRCRCGSRRTRLSYTGNASQEEEPVSGAAIALWF